MEFTYENQGINTFLVWKLAKNDVLDELVKGMVENNEIIGLLPLTFSQNNLDRYIKYNISSKVTLKQYLSGMVSRRNFLQAMLSLVNAVLELDDYMIDRDKLLLDLDHIYINVGTAQVGLVVFPVEKIVKNTDLGGFFRNVMLHVQFDPNENGNYIAAILNFLNSGTPFSIIEFKKLLEEQNGTRIPAQSEKLSGVRQTQGDTVSGAVPASSVSAAPLVGSLTGSLTNTSQSLVSGTVQSEVQQPFVQPMQMEIPPQMEMQSQMEPEKKEKKGFSLFGKKKEAKPKPEKTPKPAKALKPGKKGKDKNAAPAAQSFQGGFAIPGQSGYEMPPQPAMTQQAVTPPQPKMEQPAMQNTLYSAPQSFPVNQMAAPQPMMQEVKMNFGETTVLTQEAGETTVLTANSAGAELKPYILRKKNNQKMFIEKPEFRMGKESNYVDFCITDNSAVSRSHADIITKNGAYFIRDNNSLNHTFLDGRQLQGGVEVQLENGVKFRLADEDFEFWLY